MRGVDIFEDSGNWADSYLFHDSIGRVHFSTAGEAPDELEPTRRQWHRRFQNGFYAGSVHSVTAIRNGEQSHYVLCQLG